ncbi:MAG: MoaD/ThiS family protein [Chitinophagaceae bacterium]|nr:MoaD/ThiS family protein [Oligoflexus sp.]
MSRNLIVRYFAGLKEKAGVPSETVETNAVTPSELYAELKSRYDFPLAEDLLKVSVNREYQPFSWRLSDGDEVVFIPPVSGG